MDNWKHKDAWSRRGKDFVVEVVRWNAGLPLPEFDEGGLGHRWNVYAYIHAAHPRFALIEPEHDRGYYQDAISDLPLHGGPTFWRAAFTPGEVLGPTIAAWQVGCDYSHLNDDRFGYCATAEDAREVFDDADTLFDFLAAEARQDGG